MTPAPEKAAPIPADVLALADRIADEAVVANEHPRLFQFSGVIANACARAIMQDRADRASQEENPRLRRPGGLETAVLRQPQEERIREKADDTRLSLDVEWEERIREDEPLPERLRKSYEKGAQDERDRLYKAGLKWPRDVCDFLEIEGAKVRARLRGDAS